MKKRTYVAAVAFMLASFFALALAETIQAADNEEAEMFGDIFVHPRDRHYLPGTAPSRADFVGDLEYSDERGDVSRWEYRKKNTTITRELWTNQFGETQGRLGIGRAF